MTSYIELHKKINEKKVQFSIKINRHKILKRNEGFGLAGAGGATEFFAYYT